MALPCATSQANWQLLGLCGVDVMEGQAESRRWLGKSKSQFLGCSKCSCYGKQK